MDTLLDRFSAKVNSVITGFDRIVFKGIVRPIMHAAGMTSFLMARGVLNKDFKGYAIKQSQAIVSSAEEYSRRELGVGVEYIPSLNTRKEALAHDRQKKEGIAEGLIGIWSCVESCNTFRSTFSETEKYPLLRFERSRCKHLYYYFDDPVYGFMSVRLQTWAPYEIQIALNGREWLRRSLDGAGCEYVLSGNKFLHIDDYGLAQDILDAQAGTLFDDVLDGFLTPVFPAVQEVLGKGLSYYWSFWQSEVAKDYIFRDRGDLGALMDDLMIHAMITGKGDRILRYFGSPVSVDGQPRHSTNPEIMSRAMTWYDGTRVRHWKDGNSVKFYNEHNVLRFEMTMNDPSKFRIHRHAENQCKDEPKRLMGMRKGVADTAARFEISKNIANRFSEHMAAVEEKTRLGEVVSPVTSPIIAQGKRYRALDVFGKDNALLLAVSDPAFDVHGITNKTLQGKLIGKPWANGKTGKQLSGKISRNLRLLREHGLIKKLPNQRKYALTDQGRKLTAALEAASATSINDLLKLAA
jgi:hypothetical protein